MRYCGGKSNIKKDLWEILNKETKGRVFVDLFCGACNIVEGIKATKRIANDNNPYLIALLKAVQEGWIPPDTVTEGMYYKAMNYEYYDALNGFILIGCTFGGGFRNGFARDAEGRNYARVCKESLLRQKPKLVGVEFSCNDYREVDIPDGAVVYCDIPYKGKRNHYYSSRFDYDAFYEWVDKNKHRLKIFISEYKENENPNWETVYERKSKSTIYREESKPTTEILQLVK